jgi:O-antigen/teichoic acid export membrane protein
LIVKNRNRVVFNTLSNYLGQGYAMAVAIIITPMYLKYLGAEAFGLVGFFVVLQNLLNLLDMGLSSTLVRQVAHARGQAGGGGNLRSLLRSFEIVFLVVSMGISACIFFSRGWITSNWINIVHLNDEHVAYCIGIMGVTISIRLFSTLYRGGIIGYEDQIWLNKFSVIINSLKYIGSLWILAYISNNIVHFFQYNLVVGIAEVAFLGLRFYSALPTSCSLSRWFKGDWVEFRKMLPFTLSITFSSTFLILLTQFDKLILSSALTLELFGYFSLITLVSGAVISLSTPVFVAFSPRMTVLVSEGKVKELLDLYVNLTQITTWVSLSSAVLIGVYSQELIYFLTASKEAVNWGGEVLFWYALGSGFFVLGTFQYYLQNALGVLRMHLIGSTISFIVQIPLIYFVTTEYGALGAGQLWFLFSLVWFLVWTAIVHVNFFPGFHLKWMVKDILPMLLSIFLLSILFREYFSFSIDDSRWRGAWKIGISCLLFLSITSILVRSIRLRLILSLGRFFN